MGRHRPAGDHHGMTTPTTSFDHIVSATPVDRDRVVDAMRAGSILVVVLWHWSMSVLRWSDDGSLDFLEEVLIAKGGEVNPDERNLLSVAFKNLISSKRAACRTISAIE